MPAGRRSRRWRRRDVHRRDDDQARPGQEPVSGHRTHRAGGRERAPRGHARRGHRCSRPGHRGGDDHHRDAQRAAGHASRGRDGPARQRARGAVRSRRHAGRLGQAHAPVRRLPRRRDAGRRRPVRRCGPAVDDVQIDGPPRGPSDGIGSTQTAVLEYQETAVGRLPVGPAADAALAAAATTPGPAAPRPTRARRSAEVLDLGAASRGAVLTRLVPAVAAALAAVIAIVVWRSKNS